MIRNNLKAGFRHIIKQRTLSIINIVGLSAGLTCVTFIALWVGDELSFDKFNKHYDRIVRVVGSAQTEMGTTESAVTSAPMGAALMDDFPEVESVVRMRMRSDIVHHDERQFFQDGILLADPSFFDVFTFSLSRGNQATALATPFKIVLTESSAKKYFGDKDPIGETLTINMYDSSGYGALYAITGVMPDPPENSHFTFNMLASFMTVEVANPDVLTTNGWGDASYYTYVLLRKGTDEKAFSRKIRQFYGKHIGSLFEIWKDIYSYRAQPLRDIHLRSHLQHEIVPTGDMNQIYLFSAIGVFILMLAGINYVNLAIAGSTRRAKEVGVKKVIGAKKSQLVHQYLLESILTSLLALAFSLLVGSLLQPFFHQLTAKNLLIFSSPMLIIFLVGISILLGILAGIYPAMFLSAFAPLRILKGNFQQGRQGVSLRKSLVVGQFTMTIVLVTCIIVVNSQMDFVKHQDLGYRSETLLFLKVHGNTDVINGYTGFKNEILMNPLISSATTSNTIPVGGLDGGESETIDGNGNSIQVSTSRLRTDADYLDAYGLQLSAGRNFRPGSLNDTIRPVLLNETAVKSFGWESPQSAIGKPFKIGDQYGEVLGVVRDFHFNSLHERIEPLAIYPVNERFSRITLSANLSKSGDAMAWVEEVWKKHFPTALFDYAFVDEQVGQQYFAEQRFSVIVTYFSVISLVIACLGLYGLVLFAASQKVKEIGIRKVLGASVNVIVVMLSGEFIRLVAVSAILAAPVAWYVMKLWLENFAVRTPITWWMLTGAGLLVLVLSIITVSLQAIKAALTNPVKSLKSE